MQLQLGDVVEIIKDWSGAGSVGMRGMVTKIYNPSRNFMVTWIDRVPEFSAPVTTFQPKHFDKYVSPVEGNPW